MTTFYILDDNLSAVKSLMNIIQSRNLGEIIGTNTNAVKGKAEILLKKPDIALVDILMPELDGISIVKQVKEVEPEISFIAFSQVVDKDMIADAYNAGIEFYISKPNNIIESEAVIRKVMEKREMNTVLSSIRSVIGNPAVPKKEDEKPKNTSLEKAKKILASVGMLGESGTKDILNVYEKLFAKNEHYNSKDTINSYATEIKEDPKIVKQRIRRAIKRGLTNIASIGVEDYYNEIFEEYGRTLFTFDVVRNEMDLLRGKYPYGGKPSIDKFFEGLEILCED